MGSLQNWFVACGGRGKRRRNVARAVVESGPVTGAAIIGIAELVRRLAIPADAARQRHKRFARARRGGQVDDAAAEFAGKIRRIAFLNEGRIDRKSTRLNSSH